MSPQLPIHACRIYLCNRHPSLATSSQLCNRTDGLGTPVSHRLCSSDDESWNRIESNWSPAIPAVRPYTCISILELHRVVFPWKVFYWLAVYHISFYLAPNQLYSLTNNDLVIIQAGIMYTFDHHTCTSQRQSRHMMAMEINYKLFLHIYLFFTIIY